MRRLSGPFTLLLCLGLLTPAVAAADDACHAIRGEIDLNHLTIDATFGLEGTVGFAQDSASTAPATAPPGSSVFSGILTITTADGVLTLRETGMFSSRTGDPAGPVLASWGQVVGGTGRYAGVTGDLFFAGRRVGSLFLVAVSGQLCP